MDNNKDSKILNSTQNNNNDLDNNNSEDSFVELLNSIPLNNLNDYYDIETSAFKKRCDKLNLKFYWETESLANQKEIPYPYNKLFIILFKEISLYIEEIERLNKQLRQKNKNEKYYQEKLSEYLQKEKDGLINKQKLKNVQKTNKILEKKEVKLRNEIDKLQHKININNNINISNSIVNSSFIGGNTTLTTNIKNQKLNKNFRNSHSIDNKSNYEYKKEISGRLNNNEINKELYERCINEFDEELNYLNNFQKILEERKKDIEKKINS